MLAYIPFEIQLEIFKRVHVKSLLRFRSVSKQWKSLIDSSEFITDHSVNHSQPHHLLLSYNAFFYQYKYVSLVDDDNFPHHMTFSPIGSPTVTLDWYSSMLDCSHGLVCLFHRDPLFKKKLVVLWNPSIRKSVGIALPYAASFFGFGVCPKTSDPKIFSFTHTTNWKAEVFTLSTGAWRRVPMKLRMPIRANGFKFEQVVINGVIHWIAYNTLDRSHGRIISFDLTTEEFGELDLPNSLASSGHLSISKLKESLVVLDYYKSVCDYYKGPCNVWMVNKDNDMKPSFTKLFTFSFKALKGSRLYKIMGFRNNGQLITRHIWNRDGYNERTSLEVYQPSIKHSNDLGSDEAFDLLAMTDDYPHFTMASYTESLLLLNHSDSISDCGRSSCTYLFYFTLFLIFCLVLFLVLFQQV